MDETTKKVVRSDFFFVCSCNLGMRNVIPPRSWVADQHQYAKFGYIFLRVGKTKKFEVYSNVLPTAEKGFSETCSAKRHVFPLRFIYAQAK